MKSFNIVAAVDARFGIGKKGKLPWHLRGDMKHFKELTMTTQSSAKKNAVIMGRKTWESLPEKFRPLVGRINVVLTRNAAFSLPDGVLKSASLTQALAMLGAPDFKAGVETVFVIGGGEILQEALKSPACQTVYLTRILAAFDCDVFFPELRPEFKETLASPPYTEDSIEYYFTVYRRI